MVDSIVREPDKSCRLGFVDFGCYSFPSVYALYDPEKWDALASILLGLCIAIVLEVCQIHCLPRSDWTDDFRRSLKLGP